jgi:hypothetical protein
MYQKLIIREADAHVRVWTRRARTKDNRERNRRYSRDDVIRPDRMIICSDWPTILRCSTTFGYKKDDGRGCDRE